MKGILNLFPVALAVASLASCSNDDFLAKSEQELNREAGDLIATFDPFENENVTRSMLSTNMDKILWQDGDVMNVYDNQLYATDFYVYNSDSENGKGFFYASTGEPMVTTPQYTLFPGDMVARGYVDRESRTVKADIDIPHVIVYDAESETKKDTTHYYACNLPAFGIAEYDNVEGRVASKKMRYLTAILQLTLDNSYSNVTWLKITNTKHKKLSGRFVAALSADEEGRKNVKLEELTDELVTSYEDLYIDLRKVSSPKSVLYIPMIAGLNGDTDGLTLSVTTENVTDYAKVTKWTTTGLKFPNTIFQHHSVYKASHSFALEDMTPNKLTEMLEQYKESEDDIVIDLAKKFTIADDNAGGGYAVKLPQFSHDVNVTINLAETFTTWNNTTTTKALTFQNANNNNPFTGKLTINVGEKLPANKKITTTVNLSSADVVLIGNFDKSWHKTNAGYQSTITLTNAKTITFGDGETTTAIDKQSLVFGSLEKITVAKEASITPVSTATNGVYSAKAKEIIVNGTVNGKVTGANTSTSNPTGTTLIEINGTVTNQSAEAVKTNYVETNVLVTGKVEGNVNMTLSTTGTLTVTGTKASGSVAAVPAQIDGDVTTKGEVVIVLTAEGEAITGKLTMQGTGKTVNLQQGYVNEIVANTANTGSWEENVVNLKLDDPKNDGLVAFKKLTETKGYFNITTSKWLGNSISSAYSTYAYTATVDGTDENSVLMASNMGIFTASQLAYYQNNVPSYIRLMNNLNMNNKEWAGIKNGSNDGNEFEGNSHTISNLKLKSANAAANGLFKEISNLTNKYTIKNLKLTSVQAAITNNSATNGIGALIGSTLSAAVEVKDVTVTLKGNFGADATNVNAFKAVKNVGGLIGYAKGQVTLDNVAVTAGGSICGYANLGGLIGNTAGSNSLVKENCTVKLFVGNPFAQGDNGKEMDMNYASIGHAVGTISGGSIRFETITNFGFGTDLASEYEGTTYSSSKTFTSDTDDDNGNFYWFTRVQPFVGYSGKTALGGTIQVGKATPYTTYVIPSKVPKGSLNPNANQAWLYYFNTQRTNNN